MRSTATVSVNWARLSDRGAWILRYIEVPVSMERKSYRAVSAATGVSAKRFRSMRRELREEVAQIAEKD